jgi:hypothetical protein
MHDGGHVQTPQASQVLPEKHEGSFTVDEPARSHQPREAKRELHPMQPPPLTLGGP